MLEVRPFKIIAGSAALVVMAVTVATAEAHARAIATKDFAFSVANLPEAEYATTDFSAVTRIEGGKEDAAVYPFVIVLNDAKSVHLATSQAIATKYVEDMVKEKAGFSVEPLPVTEYATVDWANVETLVEPEKSKRGRKSNAERAAAESEGDAKDQIAMGGIPGMDA